MWFGLLEKKKWNVFTDEQNPVNYLIHMGESRKPLKVFRCDWPSFNVLFGSSITLTLSPIPIGKTTALLPVSYPKYPLTSHRHTTNVLFFQMHATELGVPLVNMVKRKKYSPLIWAVNVPAKWIQIINLENNLFSIIIYKHTRIYT